MTRRFFVRNPSGITAVRPARRAAKLACSESPAAVSRGRTLHSSLRCLASIAAVLAAPTAFADRSPALDRVSLWLGGYYANTDLEIGAQLHDGNLGTGKLDFATGHETVGRARIDFLVFDSQGFSVDYYTLDHSSSKTLQQPFSYDGIPFVLDATLTGKLDFTAGSAAWHWWFGNQDDVFGIGLGATYYRAKLGIDGSAAVDNQQAATSVRWDEDAVAPLITAAWKHAFSDDLRIYLDASGVKKNGGKLSGHLYDARIGVEWFPWHNAGFGAEYGVTRIKLDRGGRLYDANLDIQLDGPSLFARLRF